MENQYDFIKIADDRFKLSNIEKYYIINSNSYGTSGTFGISTTRKLRIVFKQGGVSDYISDVDKYVDELDYYLLRKREKDEL